MDMMNRAYGELIGGWIGKFVTVEVDEEGMAWGEDLRIRVEIRVDQPLLHGVPLKNSDEEEEGKWFDLKYERVPHFCFDCGCLVHPSSGCGAENAGGVQQWGEWLRASPRKSQRPPASARPSVSSGSYSGRSTGAGSKQAAMPSVRDLPPRRNLLKDYSGSSLSHTGGYERQRGSQEVTSPGSFLTGGREIAGVSRKVKGQVSGAEGEGLKLIPGVRGVMGPSCPLAKRWCHWAR
jgi:hypothetical protein